VEIGGDGRIEADAALDPFAIDGHGGPRVLGTVSGWLPGFPGGARQIPQRLLEVA